MWVGLIIKVLEALLPLLTRGIQWSLENAKVKRDQRERVLGLVSALYSRASSLNSVREQHIQNIKGMEDGKENSNLG